MELWQCRRCGTWVEVEPIIIDILKMRTVLCEECFVIETRELYDKLRKTNGGMLKFFREMKYETIKKTV